MEHLTWHQRSWFLLVRRVLFGGVVGGWGLVSGVPARCWVLRDRTPPVGGVQLSGPLLPAGWSCGGGAARTLRTTQWTRASLQDDLFGGCFVLMILKIISQFLIACPRVCGRVLILMFSSL